LSLSIPEIRAGEQVTVTAVISNNGEADVIGISVTLYEGQPLTGIPVATQAITVPAFSTATASFTWTPAQAGAHLLSVYADPSDTENESDEANNDLSTTNTVGWDALMVDAGAAGDTTYNPTQGYGWLTQNATIVNSCGSAPEQTYRQASSVDNLDYRFDNLLPGRFYHLDLTFAVCSGQRWVNVFVDGTQVGETSGEPFLLSPPQSLQPINVTTTPQTASILLNPSAYADGTVTLSIQRAQGLNGPVVNIIDLVEIEYCYRDSGPGEAAWTASNDCGFDPAWPSDVFNGWGTTPEQTVRFSDTGQVKYRFTELDPAKEYNLRLTFYEGDGVGREQRLLVDSTPSNIFLLSGTVKYIYLQIPLAEYADGEVNLTIERVGLVGDLIIRLTHLDTGSTVTLLDRPGIPPSGTGCTGNDIDATLNDEAALSMEGQCAPSVPTIFGTFTPHQALSTFDGQSLAGSWRLTAIDRRAGETGTLVQWCLLPTENVGAYTTTDKSTNTILTQLWIGAQMIIWPFLAMLTTKWFSRSRRDQVGVTSPKIE